MLLPSSPQSPNLSPEAFNFLFPSATDGIGKSSLLASVENLLILDPDKSCKALPGYIVDLPNWRECLDLLKTLRTEQPTMYSGIGVDNLNIFHDHLFTDFIRREKHPADANDMGKTWNKLTREWISWLRDLRTTLPGMFIATCHTNIIELKIKNNPFNKYVPAIPGGGPRGAYRQTMEMFDIIGFMTREGGEEATKAPKDARADVLRVQTQDVTVIHFLPSIYWEAKDNSRQLPHKVTLSSDWKEDWKTILTAWGAE